MRPSVPVGGYRPTKKQRHLVQVRDSIVANQDNEGSGGDRLGNHPGSAGTQGYGKVVK